MVRYHHLVVGMGAEKMPSFHGIFLRRLPRPLIYLTLNLFSSPCHLQLAAKRYVHYWEKRVEICGPEKAFQPLTLAADGPLHDDGDTALAIGFLNYVEGPADAAGRGVLVVFPGHQDRTQYTRPAMARAAWYIIHALLDSSPTVQKHGLLFLAHPHGAKFGQFDRALMKIMLGSIQGALPVRLSAFHICQPPPFFKIILPIAKLFMTERTKKRLNVHFGSPAEICHKLTNTFGMHKECIPEALGGTLTIDMAAWVAQRRAEGK